MMNRDARQRATSARNNNLSPSIAAWSIASARQRFLFETALIMRSDAPRVDVLISQILAETVADADFLEGLTIQSAAERYTRTALLSTESYCVLAIVWQPGQMSPVHSHRAWCALGVHAGTLTETHFEPITGGPQHGLRLSGCRQLHAGSTSHGPAHDHSAHRMANLGIEPAISIHVYGTAFEKLGSDLNQIWAE